MDLISISTQERSNLGGSGSSETRAEGRIPAVVYGGGSSDHISVVFNEVKKLIYTPEFRLAELDLNGSKQKAIVKEVQFHPLTDEILHIDFLRLIDGVPVKVEIPIKFKGTSPGVKEGGALVQAMRKVKIKAKPENLVDEIYCDISGLKLGQSVRVRELEINDNLELMSAEATPVALVEIPRALRSKEAMAAREEEA